MTYRICNRKAVFGALSIFLSTGGVAEEPEKSPSFRCSGPLLEVKTGYFFFSDPTLRKVYNKGGFDIRVSGSYPLWSPIRKWTLNAYGAIEYFERSGNSIHEEQNTSLWSLPVTVGINPVYAISNNFRYYFATGPRYFYIHQHNQSSYVYSNKSRNGIGFFVNTGFYYLLCNHIAIDIFGEYSYGETRFHSKKSGVYTRTTQVGGFTFGTGFGYEF